MARRLTKEIQYVRLNERRIREIEDLVASWPYETRAFMRARLNQYKPSSDLINTVLDRLLSLFMAAPQKKFNILKDPDILSILFGFHILLGYPGEDENTVRETCELINELDPFQISIQVGVRIYPNTPLAGETRGVLWKKDEDLIKPIFSDMDMPQVTAWVKKYLHSRYTQFRQRGNMILINE